LQVEWVHRIWFGRMHWNDSRICNVVSARWSECWQVGLTLFIHLRDIAVSYNEW